MVPFLPTATKRPLPQATSCSRSGPGRRPVVRSGMARRAGSPAASERRRCCARWHRDAPRRSARHFRPRLPEFPPWHCRLRPHRSPSSLYMINPYNALRSTSRRGTLPRRCAPLASDHHPRRIRSCCQQPGTVGHPTRSPRDGTDRALACLLPNFTVPTAQD